MALPDYLPGRFALARGRPSDYFALEHFHYLPKRPATYADVWVARYAEEPHAGPRGFPRLAPPLAAGCLRDARTLRFHASPPRAAGLNAAALNAAALHDAPLRFAQHDALDAHRSVAARRDAQAYDEEHDDDVDAARVVAVAVLSYPTICSTPRERTLGLHDCTPRQRAAFVNGHVRTISRVVVHPQFRGLGLASELVRKLIEVCPTRYVEASAVMAHVHPFFAAAGMYHVEDDRSERSDTLRPAYFIFDKAEGSPCDADGTM